MRGEETGNRHLLTCHHRSSVRNDVRRQVTDAGLTAGWQLGVNGRTFGIVILILDVDILLLRLLVRILETVILHICEHDRRSSVTVGPQRGNKGESGHCRGGIFHCRYKAQEVPTRELFTIICHGESATVETAASTTCDAVHTMPRVSQHSRILTAEDSSLCSPLPRLPSPQVF